ncbi:MAG: hypothetical protein HOG49_38870, partial [Candidatus Scalindua sp.]|nr:hypothetical protein [Candidatus Scalindua sp.]
MRTEQEILYIIEQIDTIIAESEVLMANTQDAEALLYYRNTIAFAVNSLPDRGADRKAERRENLSIWAYKEREDQRIKKILSLSTREQTNLFFKRAVECEEIMIEIQGIPRESSKIGSRENLMSGWILSNRELLLPSYLIDKHNEKVAATTYATLVLFCEEHKHTPRRHGNSASERELFYYVLKKRGSCKQINTLINRTREIEKERLYQKRKRARETKKELLHQKNKRALISFLNKEKRIPSAIKSPEDEERTREETLLVNWYYAYGKKDIEVKTLWDRFKLRIGTTGHIVKERLYQKRKRELISFFDEEKRIPSRARKEEMLLVRWYCAYGEKDIEVKALWNRFRHNARETKKELLHQKNKRALISFFDEEKRIPSVAKSLTEETLLVSWYRTYGKKDIEVKALWDRFKLKKKEREEEFLYQKNKRELISFFDEEKHIPSRTRKEEML